LELVAVSRFQRFLVDWAALVYVMLIAVAEGIFVERQIREARNQAVSKMLETGRPQVSSEESEKTSLFERH
jgi:hypothetical protein